ncbi:MAG: energy-coupling factor ABC transporter permease [Ilumatobacteraceae bacterium]
MHIPDGFIDAGTSAVVGALAVGGVALSVRRSSGTLDDRQVPMAGLAASFIFAAQMLNFPVAAGTSGHLLGAGLAAVLVGPAAGALCLTVVLIVQALLFADGGLSALGLNVFNMAIVGVVASAVIFRGLRAVLPRTRSSVVVASGIAAGLTPAIAALAFTAQYALGGNDAASVGTVATAMVGVHLLIGIGEGVITALTVGAVLGVRPDLVAGASHLRSAISVPVPVAVSA